MKIVAMASFPPRMKGMLAVVQALLPQCDKFHLYLNGYDVRPAELPNDPKLDVVLAGNGSLTHQDLGSQGKFFWCGAEDGYYLTVDDDIHYPTGYVDYMVKMVDKYERKAIVGLHGGLYRITPGGQFPPTGMVKDHRTLFGYDKAVPKDMPVHILGAGVMAMHPKTLGITFENCCTGAVHSGDDEDVALWAQKNKVPLIRVMGKQGWVRPNSAQWTIDPLHRRIDYLKAADTKIKAWKKWVIHPIPRPTAPASQVPLSRKPKAAGPSFDDVLLSDEDRMFCNKILSSDALAAHVVDRIKRKTPTSVIRMSDGERAIMAHAQTGEQTSFLKDIMWLRRYGLEGADLKRIGRELLWAGQEADFLACTISGIFWNCFRVHNYFPERTQFIDSFYPRMMLATDRVGAILRAGPVLVLHREHDKMADLMRQSYEGVNVSSMSLNSWRDHELLLRTVPKHPAQLVLLSGGAAGKVLAVKLAKASDKTVLDVGEGLGQWANPSVAP